MPDRVSESTVVIGLVRPDLLGTYGDGGNAVVLRERLRRRGIAAEVREIGRSGDGPASADLYVLGGGEDSAEVALAADERVGAALRTAAGAGTPIFAVCAGFQVLGETFADADGKVRPGFGLLDVRTSRRLPERAVGEVVGTPTIEGVATLTGFENHGGATDRGPGAAPLARVTRGIGNGDATDGAVQGHIIATYLHGPALARNPDLADLLLGWVVGSLPPLDLPEVERLRRERLAAG
ncbi:MAG TPA: hypothetical protein VHN98_12005 [Acidimicrobiales bacterium]|nr:hypothetical protein [Acidimicrobiales bacterium]